MNSCQVVAGFWLLASGFWLNLNLSLSLNLSSLKSRGASGRKGAEAKKSCQVVRLLVLQVVSFNPQSDACGPLIPISFSEACVLFKRKILKMYQLFSDLLTPPAPSFRDSRGGDFSGRIMSLFNIIAFPVSSITKL